MRRTDSESGFLATKLFSWISAFGPIGARIDGRFDISLRRFANRDLLRARTVRHENGVTRMPRDAVLRGASARADAEFGLEQVFDRLRIGFAARRLHHLADKPADHRRLRLRLLRLVGIGGDDVVHDLLDRAESGDLLQPEAFNQRFRVATLRPDDLEQVLGDLAGDRALADQIDNARQLIGGHRRGRDGDAFLVQPAEQLVDDPVRRQFAFARLVGKLRQHRLVEVGALAFRHQNAGIIGREAKIGDETGALLVRQLRQVRFQLLDIGLGEFQRQKVGIREVAIVVCLFLGAHRARLALVGIVKPGFLVDRAAVFDDFDLPARLILDRVADKADRVHVLDLAAGAEPLARPANRDVDVRAQVALLHVTVAGAEIAQDRAQLRDIALRLIRRAYVRLGDDLHESHAGTVQVHERQGRVLVVDRLAGVLLEVKPLDTNLHHFAVREFDGHLALADDRLLELADLVALRQVRIEVVLPVEGRFEDDLRLQAEAGADRLRDTLLIDDRQHTGHRRVHQ